MILSYLIDDDNDDVVDGDDNDDDDEEDDDDNNNQVEAGMSDAADVMRDLLRKGLQVDIVIVLTFQISIVVNIIIINMVINMVIIIKNNMIIMIKTSGGFVCTTSRVASNRGGDFSLRYKFTWKGTSSVIILIMISEFVFQFL